MARGVSSGVYPAYDASMSYSPSTLERAFQLANTGEFRTVTQIGKRLTEERYTDVRGQLYGRSVRTSLVKLCVAARERTDAPAK